MRKIKKIIIHHSASSKDLTTVKNIKKWHKEKGFSDVGYHWMIDGEGRQWQGRPEHIKGAHCKGSNKNSIGICVFGNFDVEVTSEKQIDTLTTLLEDLFETYGLNYSDVYPHCELARKPTACPGHDLIDFIYFKDEEEDG